MYDLNTHTSWCCVYSQCAEALYRQNFEEVLNSIQSQVLQHCGGMTAEEFEAATMQYSEDPEISAIVAELESLYLGKHMIVQMRAHPQCDGYSYFAHDTSRHGVVNH